jgi:hypothetical protein
MPGATIMPRSKEQHSLDPYAAERLRTVAIAKNNAAQALIAYGINPLLSDPTNVQYRSDRPAINPMASIPESPVYSPAAQVYRVPSAEVNFSTAPPETPFTGYTEPTAFNAAGSTAGAEMSGIENPIFAGQQQ